MPDEHEMKTCRKCGDLYDVSDIVGFTVHQQGHCAVKQRDEAREQNDRYKKSIAITDKNFRALQMDRDCLRAFVQELLDRTDGVTDIGYEGLREMRIAAQAALSMQPKEQP